MQEKELVDALKRVHFELQEFFTCSDAGAAGGFRHLERARSFAADAINKAEDTGVPSWGPEHPSYDEMGQ